MNSAVKPTSTSGINRLRWGVRSLSSAILAAVGRDTQPEGHPDVTVTTRLRDDMRSVTWSALDANEAPVLVRAVRATALPAHVKAFKESALTLKRLHDEGPIEGLLPVLSVSDDGRSFVMPSLTMGTALEVPVLGWELSRTMDFFIQIARTVQALHEAGHFIGRWAAQDVLLDDDLNPVLACDLDATRSLPFDQKERDFFAPEVQRDELVDAKSDVYTLGKVLQFLVKDAEQDLGEAARKSSGFGTLVAIVGLATSKDPDQRYESVAALITAVENSLDMLPVGRLAPDRFELESEPPPKPDAAAKPKAAPTKAGAAAERSASPDSAAASLAPPTVDSAWLVGAIAVPLAFSGVGFLLNLSETAAGALTWVCAIGTAILLVRSTSRFRLRSRVIIALGAMMTLLTLDPVGAFATAGIERRLRGSRDAREAQIKTLIDRGRKSFPAQDFSEVSLADANLMMLDVSGSNLSRANFARAKLGGLIAQGANVTDANFEGADLTDSDLMRTIGWETARCDAETRPPEGLQCVEQHFAKVAPTRP